MVSIEVAIIIAVLAGIICFIIGLAIGSSGKASERERANYAVEMAESYKHQLDEIDKIDMFR